MADIPTVLHETGNRNASGTLFGAGVGGGLFWSNETATGAKNTNLAINFIVAASREPNPDKRNKLIENSMISQNEAIKEIKAEGTAEAKALAGKIQVPLDTLYAGVQTYKTQTLGARIGTAAPDTVLTGEEVEEAVKAVVNYINTKNETLFKANTDENKENALRIVRTIVLRDMMRVRGESGDPGSQAIKAIIENRNIKKYFLTDPVFAPAAWKLSFAQLYYKDAQEKNRNDVFNSLRGLIDDQYEILFGVPVVKALSMRTTSVEYADTVTIDTPMSRGEGPRYIKLHKLFANITTTGPTIINYYAEMYPKLFLAAAPPPAARILIIDGDIVKDAVFTFADREIRITYVKGEDVYGLIRIVSTNTIVAQAWEKDTLLATANNVDDPWIRVTDTAEIADIKSRVKYTVEINNTTSAEFNVNKGAIITLKATTAPELPDIPEFKFTWESANTDIASVVPNTGVVTGVNGGDVNITASIAALDLRESVTVIVSDSASAGPPLPPGTDVLPNPTPAGPVTDDNKEDVKSAFAAHQYYKKPNGSILHIIAVNGDNAAIEIFSIDGKKQIPTRFPTGRVTVTTEALATNLVTGNFSSISYGDIAKTWVWAQAGGKRKTRNRKTNLRRKTGKRSKPSRPSQSSSQQLF